MKVIYRHQEGDGTEARVCVERWLAILCWKKSQPDPLVSTHGRDSQLPGLAVVYTSLTVHNMSFKSGRKAWRMPVQEPCLKALFLWGQAKNNTGSDLQLKLHPFSSSPLTRPKTLLFCYSMKTSSLAPPSISALLLWQVADANRPQGQGQRVPLPSTAGSTPASLQALTPAAGGQETIPFIVNPPAKTKLHVPGSKESFFVTQLPPFPWLRLTWKDWRAGLNSYMASPPSWGSSGVLTRCWEQFQLHLLESFELCNINFTLMCGNNDLQNPILPRSNVLAERQFSYTLTH